MGMAASQARLLTITARIHDVEYQAQSIQNAKIQLATQSDQVYNEYLEALDATTLTVSDWQGNPIVATFNTLCGKNAVDSGNQYALKDEKGRLIVEEEIKDAYDNYIDDGGKDDPYAFAMYMLNDECIGNLDDGTFDENLSDAQTEVAEENSNDSSLNSLKESMQKILDDAEVSDYNDLDEESRAEYDELEKAYNYKLYNNYAEQVYYKATSGETDFDQEMFDYYVNIYKQIQAAGGNCISISDYNGLNGDAATDSDWLTNMVKAGKITIDIVNKDNKTGELTFSSTSPSSDTYVGYTESTAIDSKALAKAEAEYEYKMKQIDQKDEKFDMIVSNPPYIPPQDREGLQIEVKDHEPAAALFTQDEKGLEFYIKITSEAHKYMTQNASLIYEVGINQAENVMEIMKNNGYKDINYLTDLSGIKRVVYGILENK